MENGLVATLDDGGMKVRIGDDASLEEAEAIARAMATHAETDVEVYIGDAEEPAAESEADLSPIEDDLGPTDRERELLEQIEEIEEGGPEKYKEQLPEEGKLFVRDRLELWFNPERSSAGSRTESGDSEEQRSSGSRAQPGDGEEQRSSDGRTESGDGSIYMLQSRPITTISEEAAETAAADGNGEVLVEGLGASPGIASGPTRVVRKLDGLDKVGEGGRGAQPLHQHLAVAVGGGVRGVGVHARITRHAHTKRSRSHHGG
jgi:hypothetical protein